MANTFSVLSYNNTFADWMILTNYLVGENNNLSGGPQSNNYIKSTGTLFLNDPVLGLQVANNSIFGGRLQVSGVGSSAYVQNNLQVDGQIYFTNPTLGLTNSGQANIGGPLLALGSGNGLQVANSAVIGNSLSVLNNSTIGNNLSVVANTTSNNLSVAFQTISKTLLVNTTARVNDSIFVANSSFSNYVQANSSISTINTLSSFGVTTAYLQANSAVNTMVLTTNTINCLNNAYANVLQANVSVNTAFLTVSANANLASLIVTGPSTFVASSNTTNDLGIGTNLYVTGNESITGTLNVTGKTTLVASSNTTNDLGVGTNLYVTGNESITGTLNVTGKTTLVASSNTTNDLGVGGTLYTPKIVIPSGGSLLGDTIQGGALITANSMYVGTGGLSVAGNFTINGSTVYNTNQFVISSGTPNPLYGSFGVFRNTNGSSNAYIRWNESSRIWDLTSNTATEPYYRILTDQYINNTGTSSSVLNVASSFALSTANTFLQNSLINANTQLKSYVDGQLSANLAYGSGVDATQNTRLSTVEANTIYLFGALNQSNTNTVNANTQLKSYVDGQITTVNSSIVSSNTQLKSYVDGQITTVNSSIVSSNTQLKAYVDGQLSSNLAYSSGVNSTQNTRLSTVEANTIYLFGALNQTNTNITTSNTQLKSYVDGQLSANLSYLQGGLNSANSNIVYLQGIVNTQNTWISSNATYTQSIVNAANTNASNASYLSIGTVPTAQLGSGTASSSTYLRGDQTWATVPTGAVINDDIVSNQTEYLLLSSTTSGTLLRANTSSTQLYFNPSIGTLYSTTFSSLSDVTLKNNIRALTNCVDTINTIDPVEFTWKDSGKKSYGVIAQEIEKVLPALVTETDTIKAVEYQSLIAFLIGAVKELSDRIEKLENM